MKQTVFITGTDTHVGKTRVTCLILRALVARGVKAVGFKPILCGERTDAHALLNASGNPAGLTLDDLNPVTLQPPAAPYTASIIEERIIDLDAVRTAYGKLREKFEVVLVEGVGGWRVPIRRDYFVSDLAREMNAPILLVTRPNLGTLNHTLLTVEAIERDRCPLMGIVMNQSVPEVDLISDHTNGPMIEELTGNPLLARVGFGETAPDLEKILKLLMDV
ncbi:MAG: dethiobiotin synthase [Verrucomicrobiae bacterium]|nr:dethiobiotin synthase [Verrucomicrobiae bacterium]